MKADVSLTTKHRKCRLNVYIVLIMKYTSTVMQGKRELCECLTRFFFVLFYWVNLTKAHRLKISTLTYFSQSPLSLEESRTFI